MKKKNNQTEKLNSAKLEFISRNQKEFQRLKELFKRNEKTRDEVTTSLASMGGVFNQERKDRWNFLYEQSEAIFDQELAEYINKIEAPKAVNSVWRWLDYTMDIAYQEMASMQPVIDDKARYEYLKAKVFDMYCRDAREIFTELTNGRPAIHLLMGIDLSRNKGVILEEVEALVSEYQKKIGLHEQAEKRISWLPKVNELLQVWDLYEQAGKQPTRKTFRDTARITGRPLSTVKDQWRAAYEQIYGIPYDPESKYASEEKRADATQLCAKCPYLTPKGAPCYKNGEQYPCSEYLKIAGKEKNEFKEYKDDVSNSTVEENFCEDLERIDNIKYNPSDKK